MSGTRHPEERGKDRQPAVCEYPGCAEAVVQPPRGGPRRRYCSDAHRAAARRLRLRGLLDEVEAAESAGEAPRRPAELAPQRQPVAPSRRLHREHDQGQRGDRWRWQRLAWYGAVAGVIAVVVLAVVTHSTGDLGGTGRGSGRGGSKGHTLSPPTTAPGNGQPQGAGGSGSPSGAGGPGGGAGASQGQGQGAGQSPQNPGSSVQLVAQPKPTPTTTAGSPPTTSAPLAAPVTWTALTGPGCPQDSSKGVSLDAWGSTGGSWTGDGCQGFFRWSRVAGPRYVHTFTWWFDTPLSGGQDCSLSLYIPHPSDTSLAAAPAARYTVASGSGTVGSFTLNQATHRGAWFAAGTFHFPTARVQLTLSNQGTIDGTAVAAAPLRVTCQS